jgi:hypothetical protein
MSTELDDDRDRVRQLEIVALLDELHRLREDPERQRDLDEAHARLRERLYTSPDSSDPPAT